jgi:hypothetical protein
MHLVLPLVKSPRRFPIPAANIIACIKLPKSIYIVKSINFCEDKRIEDAFYRKDYQGQETKGKGI